MKTSKLKLKSPAILKLTLRKKRKVADTGLIDDIITSNVYRQIDTHGGTFKSIRIPQATEY